MPAYPTLPYNMTLTLWEKIDLLHKLFVVGLLTIYHLTTGPFRGPSGARNYRVHVGHAVMRAISSRMTYKQNHYLGVPTNKSYEIYAKEKGVDADTVRLEHGALGHWLGDRQSKKVLIYYHGGGFQLSASSVHFQFLSRQIETLRERNQDLAVFVLTYTLTPYAAYPSQLQQAVEALRHILMSYAPSNILLGGDSAGGNLVLGVLSHLSHPHPQIEALTLDESLAGAFLLSPWVSFLDNWPSEYQNRYKDVVSKKCGQRWSAAYLNGEPADNWSEPLLANPDWWHAVKVGRVLVVAGSDEILLSSIIAFGEKFKPRHCQTRFIITENEGHVAAILDALIGETTRTQQENVLLHWLVGGF